MLKIGSLSASSLGQQPLWRSVERVRAERARAHFGSSPKKKAWRPTPPPPPFSSSSSAFDRTSKSVLAVSRSSAPRWRLRPRGAREPRRSSKWLVSSSSAALSTPCPLSSSLLLLLLLPKSSRSASLSADMRNDRPADSFANKRGRERERRDGSIDASKVVSSTSSSGSRKK